jgi:hypothetical protein
MCEWARDEGIIEMRAIKKGERVRLCMCGCEKGKEGKGGGRGK